MKIIAGELRGKKLITLPGLETRPTLTRIKENIFNILQNHCNFQQLVVVDLFGGSGSLAIESLSRGAKKAFINDKNPEAVAIIRTNLTNCRLINQVQLTKLDYQVFVQQLRTKVDLIFIDSPFNQHDCQQWIINQFETRKILNKGAIFIFETNFELKDLQLNSNFTIISDKKYSKIYIKIIQYQQG